MTDNNGFEDTEGQGDTAGTGGGMHHADGPADWPTGGGVEGRDMDGRPGDGSDQIAGGVGDRGSADDQLAGSRAEDVSLEPGTRPGEGAGITEDTGGIAGEDVVRLDQTEVRGRYVKGSYGKAGTERGRLATDEEGRFVEGDYGKAGTEPGRSESLGNLAGESGRFVEADYGQAGVVPPRTGDSEVGQYAEGDYGDVGTVDPKRKPGTAKR